jgi:hypothetical protein
MNRLEKKYYIGVRSTNKAIDKDTYMGSSKSMTKQDKQNCIKKITE